MPDINHGLVIFSKDLDSHLVNHISKTRNYKIDVIFWRHRDKLEHELRFGSKCSLYSLPEYIQNISKDFKKLSFSELEEKHEHAVAKYKLRSGNRYATYDLHRARHGKMTYRQHIETNLAFITFFLEINIERYDFVVGELSRSYNLIAYDLCKYFRIEYLHPVNLGFFDGISFVDDKFQLPFLEFRHLELNSNQDLQSFYLSKAKKLIAEFRDKPKYNKNFLNSKNRMTKKFISRVFQKISNLRLEIYSWPVDSKYYVGNIYVNPLKRFMSSVVFKKYRMWANRKAHFKFKRKKFSKRIFYPLHVHPETTTTLYSEKTINNFSVQLDVIHYLSRFIPGNFGLIVKEHPHMVGTRDSGYYKEIDNLYNVDFMPDNDSQFDAIMTSHAIITHCGTVGLEALILGKPVLTLEDSYYDFMKGIIRLKNLSETEYMLTSLSTYEVDDVQLEKDLALLLYSNYENVKNFTIDHWAEGIIDENLERFVSAIERELEIRSSAKIEIMGTN